jgi:hypothetical protein
MELNEKIDLNKKIRNYQGENSFIKSLQTNLKSKWCGKVQVGNKNLKILTDKQYEAAKSILS